jgi:Kinetochore Sim4 complex subunit FTA2
VRATLSDYNNRRVSDEDLNGHVDPFYAECRAYGRIMETERRKQPKRSLVVPCYGFLGVSAGKEPMLLKRFGVEMWNREDSQVAGNEPLRALVKELVEDDLPLTDALLKKMLRDLKALRKMKIYQQDIFPRNYKGGRLVDFSTAYTEPNFMFQVRSPLEIQGYRIRDLVMFDNMVRESNVKTSVRARPNDEYRRKLRRRRSDTPVGKFFQSNPVRLMLKRFR